MTTEDKNITGVIDPKGILTVLSAETGETLVTSNLVQFRITENDVRG